MSPALAGRFFTTELSGKPLHFLFLWQALLLVGREGNGTPLQYSCLENPMNGGVWWAAVHGVAKSRTRLSDFTFTFHFHALDTEMATHSSVLAWRIPGTGEPGGLPCMGSHRVGHDWSGLAAAGLFRFFESLATPPRRLNSSLTEVLPCQPNLWDLCYFMLV